MSTSKYYAGMSTATLLANLLTQQLNEDSLFSNAFCSGCTWSAHSYDDECPAGFVIGEKGCYRAGAWSDLEDGIRSCLEIALRN